MKIEIMNLSDYDPEVDIVVMYVDVGKMTPSKIQNYLKKVKEQVGPKFEKSGFECLYIPIRDGQAMAIPDIVSKVREQVRDQVGDYNNAMKTLTGDK